MLKKFKLKRIEHILDLDFTEQQRELLLRDSSPYADLRQMGRMTGKTTLAIVWSMLHHFDTIHVSYSIWASLDDYANELPDPDAFMSRVVLVDVVRRYNTYRDLLRHHLCFVPRMVIDR